MHAKDCDRVARYLLTETDARDLEITTHGLEDAFLSLTGRATADGRRRPRPRRSPAMSATTPHVDPTTRRVPPFGGLNADPGAHRAAADAAQPPHDHLRPGLPGRRCSSSSARAGDSQESVGAGNVSAYVMVSMAMYGGALIAASAGAGVAIERALGWSRQLRLTPLHPTAYIVVKAFVALVMGAVAILAVNVVGVVQGKPQMPVDVWVKCGLLTLACVMTFAALGVFVGYLVPGENVMQVLGPGLALLAFLGGLFIPLEQYSPLVRDIAYWTPMYGVARGGPRAADPGAALVRRRQRGRPGSRSSCSAPRGG